MLLDAVEFHFHFLVNFISLLVLFSCHFPATKRRIRVLWYSEITTLAVLFLFNRIELVLSVSEDWKRSSKKIKQYGNGLSLYISVYRFLYEKDENTENRDSCSLSLSSVTWMLIQYDMWCYETLFQSGRKETVLDLAKFVDKGVQVKLTGGRQGLEFSPLSLKYLYL